MATYTLRDANPADAAALARVHVRCWQHTYRGLVPAAALDHLDEAERADVWRWRLTSLPPPAVVLLATTTTTAPAAAAEDDRAPPAVPSPVVRSPTTSRSVSSHDNADTEETVGFLHAGPPREDARRPGVAAELYGLYLLPCAQRRGLGRRLWREMRRRLEGAGCRRGQLWILEGNRRAMAFYAAMGAVVVGRQPLEVGDAVLWEVAMEWGGDEEPVGESAEEQLCV